MACGIRSRDGVLALRVEDGTVSALLGRPQVELLARQPFVEKPNAPGVAACRGRLDQAFDVGRADGEKQALEDSKIEPFVFEGKRQMSSQGGFRLMSRGQNTPVSLLGYPVTLPYCGQGAWQRHGKAVGVNERAIPGGRRPLRKPPFVKNRHGS